MTRGNVCLHTNLVARTRGHPFTAPPPHSRNIQLGQPHTASLTNQAKGPTQTKPVATFTGIRPVNLDAAGGYRPPAGYPRRRYLLGWVGGVCVVPLSSGSLVTSGPVP